jgi:uncharacterized membrane protein YdfJ with MMPL/SSD domain
LGRLPNERRREFSVGAREDEFEQLGLHRHEARAPVEAPSPLVVEISDPYRLVTAAGLVMFAVFMGFVAGSILGLQQFGFGLAMAILIDVTIVRALLVPSAMKLIGRWNWWLPEHVARVFRVKPRRWTNTFRRPSGRLGGSAALCAPRESSEATWI